jgi:hypothetical protein
MVLMKKISIVTLAISCLILSGCITDIVTVPLGLAYDVTKVAVKGTAAVVGGTVNLLTPDGKKKDDSVKSDNSSQSDVSKK